MLLLTADLSIVNICSITTFYTHIYTYMYIFIYLWWSSSGVGYGSGKPRPLPDGVSQRHGSSVDVDFVRIDVQHLDVCKNHHAEGLVDLPHGHVVLLQPRGVQHLSAMLEKGR